MKRRNLLLLSFLILSVLVGTFAFLRYQSAPSEMPVAIKEKTRTQPTPQKRAPAATNQPVAKIVPKKESSNMPRTSKDEQREWLGHKDELIKSGNLQFQNKVSKHWKKDLEIQLRRGLPEKTKLEIFPERDLVILQGEIARNTQQVVVTFQSPRERNSYRALVDSESGKIIRTWDHTIHETLRRPASLSGLPLSND